MANQFSVTPLGGLDVGAKLTNIIEGGRQQNRLNQMREKAPAVFKTGDSTQIANFMIEYPEMAATMEKATGVQDAGHKQEIVDVAKGLLTPGADPKEVIARYATALKDSGRDPKMAISMLSKIMADPNQATQMGLKLLAIHSPDESIAYQKATAPVGGVDKPVSKQKTGSFIVRDESGKQAIATGVFDPVSGTLKTETAEIPGFQLVSPLGETASEQTIRKISEAGGKKTAVGVESRASELITRGVLAAESTAVLRRGIDLLRKVETGGIDAAKHAAKRFFGVEGADEGELSNNLSKAVLSQLRETFGAQFTEGESARLIRIEAGFSKSPANNTRLLKQALRMAERTANRAKKAAKKRGDDDTVADIEDLLSFSFGDPAEQVKPPTVTTEESTLTPNLSTMTDEELAAQIKALQGGQ